MSGVIDKNIVQMVFDNTLFQKNAQDTLSTLDKLKDALNFEGAVKGLENLGSNVKSIGMDGLYNGVYKVQEGFNALDVIATRVLQNITDKIQGVATDLVEKITVEPLKAGLEEYETQINSVQTILANTNDALIENGLTTEHDRIEKINSVLDDLNKYADMTIYNFTEMTRNIGTFTAAGVELDTAATSIKGIANLAAMSGSNSQQASTAMYQLSQAIAAGSVKLQDWNSVVNAGMGGKLFQNELIDTAKAMGVADEQFTKLTSGAITFRESLSSGWISAEVLTNTLEKFTAGSEGYTKSQVEQMKQLWRARGYSEQQIESLTGSINKLDEEQEKNLRTKWAEKGFSDEQIDHILSMGMAATDAATKVKTFSQLLDTVGEALQSGWTQSWEYIIGDFEQAKMLWTEISDIMNLYIGKSADARNNVLKEWSRAAYSYNENGELIKLTYDEAGKLIEDADEQIVKDGKMIREEMGGRELVIQSMRNTFQGMFEVAMEFGKAWDKNFWGKGTQNDISITAQKLKDMSLALYDFSTNFKKAFERNKDGEAIGILGQLRQSFDLFASSIRNGYDGIKSVFSGLGNIFKAFSLSEFFNVGTLDTVITAISTITGRIKDFGDAFNKHFGDDNTKNKQGLIKFFNAIVSVLETDIDVKLNFFASAFDAFGSVLEHLIQPFGTFSQLLGKGAEKVRAFTDAFGQIIWDEDVSKFETFFKKLADSFNGFIDSLRNTVDFSGFSKFFNNLIEAMTSDKIDLFKVFENVFGGLVDIFKAFLAVATPVSAAFANIFSGAIAEALQFVRDLSDRFKAFTESLVANQEVMSGIQHLFEGIFSVLKAVGEVVGTVLLAAWDSLAKIISKFIPDSKSLGATLTDTGDKLKGFADVISSLVKGDNGVPKLSDLIGKITDKFIGFFGALKDISLLDKLKNLIEKIGDGIKLALGGTEDMSLFDTIIAKLKGFLDGIKNILSDGDGNIDFVKVLEAGGIGVALKKLIDFIKDIKDRTNDLKGVFGFIDDFKEIFESLAKSFGDWTKAQNIKFIATAMLEMAGAMFILSMIDPVALGKAVAAMAGMFQMIERVLVILSTLDKGKVAAGAAAITAMGTAMLEMAGAVAIIGNMDLADALQGVVAIGLLIGGLVVAAQQLSKLDKDIPKVAGALIALAVAIDLLTIPVVTLGNMDFVNLVKGLGAVAIMIAGLVVAADKLSNKATDMIQAGAGFVLMATGISILAGAVNKVAGLSWEDLGKGLAVFAVGLVGMVAAASVIDAGNLEHSLMSLGGAMIMLGVAMTELAIAAKIIQGIAWEDLGKMAAVFAVALIGLGVASYAINGQNLLMIAGAIALVATAFLELNAALGIAQLVGPLCTSISFAIEGVSHSLESFANSAARDAFLQFIKDAILFLPELAVGLANALIAMVVTLGEGAAKIVNAVVQIGKAVLQGIASLLPELFNVVRTFIDQLIQLVISETPRIFEALTVFFEQLWVFLTAQVPNFFMFLTTVFTELFTFLQTEAPLLIETIRIVIDTILQAIIAEAPVIGETLLTLLGTLLEIINTAIPEISFTLLNLITNILQQLAEFVPQMAQAAMEIILGFLQAIAENIGQITEAAISIAIGFMQGITEKMPELVDTAFKMIIGFIDGLATAIDNNHNALFDAVGHLIKSIVEALLDGVGKLAKAVGEWFTGPGGIIESIKGFVHDLFEAGANLVQGFIDGITSMPGQLWDAACGLARDAWSAITGTLQEHSPSRLTYGGGMNFSLGFANGIDDYSGVAESASSDMAYGVLGAFNSALADGPNTYNPEVVPILDDSNVVTGLNSITGSNANIMVELTSRLVTFIDDDVAKINNQIKEVGDKVDQIIEKHDTLYERVDYWLESIQGDTVEIAGCALKGTELYMDTGSLVGAIAPEMDEALGMRMIQTSRGVM